MSPKYPGPAFHICRIGCAPSQSSDSSKDENVEPNGATKKHPVAVCGTKFIAILLNVNEDDIGVKVNCRHVKIGDAEIGWRSSG